MPVLGAHLAGEEDELLRTDALGVHVDDELQPNLLELSEPEVGHLDRVTFRRGEHDPSVREHRGRPLARLTVGQSRTASPLPAERWSASSVRA